VSREVVPFKMPLKGQHGVPLQTLDNEQPPSRSEMDHWVQYGRLTERPAAAFVMPSELGQGAAIILTPDRIAESASDAPAKTAAAADTALPRCETKLENTGPGGAAPAVTIDIERLSNNFARLIEQGCKAIAACLRAENERLDEDMGGEIIGVARTFGHVAEYWLTHPDRAIQLQTHFGKAFFDLWLSATKRMLGAQPEPVAGAEIEDRRFADPAWLSSPFLDVVKRAYLLTSQWACRLIKEANGVDPHTRRKAEFYVRQFTDALSPANFVLTNPELLRETLHSNAGNLVSGMQMLAEDIKAGRGHLKIRHSDVTAFEVGRNLAITPGKVIYQNDLMQLIQYAPTTGTVLKRPILIVPPWINKYYILDLVPEKSFVKWCVDSGLTVFVISWVNPDARLAGKGFEDYMREGPLAALAAVATATGEERVHTIGYCAGGTLLAATLAYMVAKGDDRALSATLLTTQVDFTHAGDILNFIDEEQVQTLERRMSKAGFLDGDSMAMAFNLLRSNDLIWSPVIRNYLKGKPPRALDFLSWNSDATRIPAACHSFYLRNCYLDNRLANGEMVLTGDTIDLGRVTTPIYVLATREDHIAPAKSVFLGSKLFGGRVTFVVAGSGHIAGVINPPYQVKYSHWVDGPFVSNVEIWLAKAAERPGSWWPHWRQWVRQHDPTEVSPRTPGGSNLKPLEDAPGSYVKVKTY
jgi:polyhydroxyalkanoate synthase